MEYCKAILRRGEKMEALVIHRPGDYHGEDSREAPSASFLRSRQDWEGYVPEAALELFRGAVKYDRDAGERAWLARLRSMTEAEFEALPYGSEGLWRKLMAAARQEARLEAILESCKSKRYARSRLQRMLLCAYLGITEDRMKAEVPYVRVLAVNERGKSILRQLRKSSQVELLHPGDRAPQGEYGELERRAEDLYGLFARGALPQGGQLERERLRIVDR